MNKMKRLHRRRKRKWLLGIILVLVGVRFLTTNFYIGNISQSIDQFRQSLSSLGRDDFWKDKEGQYPEQLIELAKKNPETRQFVKDYPKQAGKAQKIRLTSSDLTGNQESGVPLFLQWDERWGYRKYGNDFMALTGCGPTCLAMVACHTFQNDKWNPWKVAKLAQKNGFYVKGQGSAWSLMTDGAAMLGLSGTEMSCDEDVIRRTLQEGHVIICAMRPGDFTTAGHFLVLSGMKDDQQVIINDPNSRKNSEKAWRLSRVVPQIKNLWKY